MPLEAQASASIYERIRSPAIELVYGSQAVHAGGAHDFQSAPEQTDSGQEAARSQLASQHGGSGLEYDIGGKEDQDHDRLHFELVKTLKMGQDSL